MYRFYFYLVTFVSIMTMPVSVLAEKEEKSIAAHYDGRSLDHTANAAGFYTVLPTVNSKYLVELLRIYQAALEQREEEITRYLDENQMDTADVLITVIMPGGLVYAAARKASLEEAKSELTEIYEDMGMLSRDLVLIQTQARQLALAQLH